MHELNGITIGRYLVEKQLAKGGMSQIYLACDVSTDCRVAIKFVHSSNSDYCARFRREVNTMVTLRHKHILPVLDYGEYSSWYYMVTPYIANGTLHDCLSQGALGLTEAGVILEQLAAALQFAHDDGVIHRDIKPSNILLLDEQHAYLADFGLVKSDRDDDCITEPGYLIGTPEYMAPELAEHEATCRSDIYALGILLYQMVAGKVPFRGSTPLSSFLKQLSELPAPPSTLNPLIPFPVDIVILRALDKNPLKRFESALALSHAYQQAVREPERLPIEALTMDAPVVRIVPWRRITAKIKVSISALVAMVIMTILLLACVSLVTISVKPERYSAPEPSLAAASIHHDQPSALPTPTPSKTAGKHSDAKCPQPFQSWVDDVTMQQDKTYNDSDAQGSQKNKRLRGGRYNQESGHGNVGYGQH